MLPRILPLLLFCIVVTPIWVDRLLLRHKALRFRIAYYAPHAAMLLATVFLTIFEGYTPGDTRIKNIYITLFFLFNFPETIWAFFLTFAHKYREHRGWANLLHALGLAAALGLAYVVAVGSTWGVRHLQPVYQSISCPQLPDSFDGYRIVQLSDIHLGTFHNDTTFLHNVVTQALAAKPDIIVFTGDLINYHSSELTPFIPILRRLHAKNGVYSILGNHDYMVHYPFASKKEQSEAIRQLLLEECRMGWQPLVNSNKIIRHKGGDKIAIVGIENEGHPPFPQRGDIRKALSGLPATCKGKPLYKILLSHDPYAWRHSVLPQSDIQLTLSGHTHGGQIRLFGFSLLSLFRGEREGIYRENHRKLYVSTGLGGAFFPVRYKVWPQINIITLKKQ